MEAKIHNVNNLEVIGYLDSVPEPFVVLELSATKDPNAFLLAFVYEKDWIKVADMLADAAERLYRMYRESKGYS